MLKKKAESLNNYFINIGTNLTSKIPTRTEEFDSYLRTNLRSKCTKL